MGPGTNVLAKLQSGVKPVSWGDRVAMYHDIDYLSNKGQNSADLKAIFRAFRNPKGPSLDDIALVLGLSTRMVADGLASLLPGKTHEITHFNKGVFGDDTKDDLLRDQALLRAYMLDPYPDPIFGWGSF